jgi:hypothetical protein
MEASGALARFGPPVRPEVMAETLIHLLRTPAEAAVDHITLRPL